MCENQTLNMIKKAIKPRNRCKTKIPPPLELLELKGNKIKSSLNQHKTLKFRYMVKRVKIFF